MLLRAMWIVMVVSLAGVERAAHGQCNGESATGSPCAPRIISGAPGVHEVVMDTSNVVGAFATACGFNVDDAVWFEVTPTSTGLLTFSTCHPSTAYDTVVQPWRATGDCEFPERLDDLCTDDTSDPACVNACDLNPRSSRVTFRAIAGTTYLFQVGSYNDNDTGCDLCLGVRVTICGGDTTPPVAQISSPDRIGCSCDGTQIVGTAYDAESGIIDYTLEYSQDGSSTWQMIAQGNSEVIDGVLGNLSSNGLSQGFYTLRLTATNACGLTSTDVQTIWVDASFDSLDFRSPAHRDVVGGLVCFDGTVFDSWCFDQYVARYRPVAGGPFIPVDPSNPIYQQTVVNDPIARWDTMNLGVPDGDYEIEIAGATICGNAASLGKSVAVDNTPPTAAISNPVHCSYVDGLVPIFGTANDAHLKSWVLQYTGGGSNHWQTIASGQNPIVNNLIAEWDTSALPFCSYTLRLVVTDTAVLNCNSALSHRVERTVSVNVGFCGDFDSDDDGDVDLFDHAAFLTEFVGPIP